jgi:DeoR/GlpR family transcriptional regulator of sugar metabolism
MQIIETVLTTGGKVRTRDLAQRFDIGQNLLANDINYLVDLGQLVRGHGWVMRKTTTVDDLFAGTEFASRQSRNALEKKAIAKYVVSQLHDGDQVLLDAGSTALAVGSKLVDDKRNLDIITNNVPLILHLASHSSLSCQVVGGDYDRDRAATTGVDAAKMIEGRKVDAAVLTPRALSLVDSQTAQATGLPTGRAVQKAIRRLAVDLDRKPEEIAEQNLYFSIYSMDPSQHLYKSTLVKNATTLFIALDHTKFFTSGQCYLALILTDLISEHARLDLRKETRTENALKHPALLPVRTRGAVLIRRTMAEETMGRYFADLGVEDPVDLRDPDSMQIVTTTEDGEHPPAELVRLLRSLRGEPQFEQLMRLAKKILVVVAHSGQPIPDDWIDRFVLP